MSCPHARFATVCDIRRQPATCLLRRRREAAFATQGSWRVVRTVWQAALVAVDYKWSFRGLERGIPEYRAMREIVDARAAQRLLEVCRCGAHPGY